MYSFITHEVAYTCTCI